MPPSDDTDPSAYATAVGANSKRFDHQPTVLVATVVSKQAGSIVHIVDEDIQVTIVVEVAEGNSSRRACQLDCGTGSRRNVFEPAVAEIAIKNLWLSKRSIHSGSFDFRIHMTIGQEDVEPTIVIDINETTTPA